jgi:hypothetical protein
MTPQLISGTCALVAGYSVARQVLMYSPGHLLQDCSLTVLVLGEFANVLVYGLSEH